MSHLFHITPKASFLFLYGAHLCLSGAQLSTAPVVSPELPPEVIRQMPVMPFWKQKPLGNARSTDPRAIALAEKLKPYVTELFAALENPPPPSAPPIYGPFPEPEPSEKLTTGTGHPVDFLDSFQRQALSALRWRVPGRHLEIRTFEQDGLVRFLSAPILEEGAEVPEAGYSLGGTTARSFLSRQKNLLGVKEGAADFRILEETKDSLGITCVRLQQVYQGLEVWPAQAIVQLNPMGHADVFFGTYVRTPETVDMTPNLTMEDSASLIRAEVAAKSGFPVERITLHKAPELVVHAYERGQPARLAYRAQAHASFAHHWTIYIDADEGTTLQAISEVCTAATTGSGVDETGVTRSLNLWQEDGFYWLVDASKPMYVAGTNPVTTGQKRGIVYSFDANDQENWNTNLSDIKSLSQTSGFTPSSVSAAYNISRVYDFFYTKYGRNSFDGSGGSIVVFTNVNEFNATFSGNGEVGIATFGNQDRFASCLDVMAHEFTHGVVAKSAKLVYQNSSGALNEGISDIFGESAESHYKSGSDPDWLVGTGLRVALRNMQNPSLYDQPSHMREYKHTSQDNGGVHINSGIINKVFYLMAKGMNSNIGINKAQAIFYRALTTKLQQNSDFTDCRLACLQSASELYGSGSVEVSVVGQAFDQVGILDQGAVVKTPSLINAVSGPDSILALGKNGGAPRITRYESSMGNAEIGSVSPLLGKRISISGDGKVAAYVTNDYNICLIFTETGELVSSIDPELSGDVFSVAISPDRKAFGFVFRDSSTGNNLDSIVVYKSENGVTNVYIFYLIAPVNDGQAIASIEYADTLEFSPDGRILYYDAYNKISQDSDSNLDGFSLYALDTKTESTYILVPPIPGFQSVNPSLGKIHPNILSFEIASLVENKSYIITLDMFSGQKVSHDFVDLAYGLAFPCYRGDDTDLYFTKVSNVSVCRIPMASDGIYRNGETVEVIMPVSYLSSTSIYRRGTYYGLPSVSLSVIDSSAAETNLGIGQFTLTRTGPTTNPLQVTYLLTGTADNASDFNKLNLIATIPTGQTSTVVTVTPINDTRIEDTETIVLTIGDNFGYSFDDLSRSGTAWLYDNDATDNYTRWLVQKFGETSVNDPTQESLVWGPTADSDKDGLGNQLEAYFGLIPTVVDKPYVVVSKPSATTLQLRWQEATDTVGLTSRVQWSPDLKTWYESGSGPTGQTRIITVTDLGVVPSLPGVGKQAVITPGTFTKAYLRLVVTKP